VALIATSLRHDEAQVGVDHPLLGLEVAALNPLRELDLLGGGQQRVLASTAQEQLQGIPGAARGVVSLDRAQLRTANYRSVRVGGPATALSLGGRRGRRAAGTSSCIGFCSVATRARNGVATL
jgi:hypothetical protein